MNNQNHQLSDFPELFLGVAVPRPFALKIEGAWWRYVTDEPEEERIAPLYSQHKEGGLWVSENMPYEEGSEDENNGE